VASIAVERRESPASAEDLDAVFASLDTQPGLWMGCDVLSEGLFRKEYIACARPAVRFSVEGGTLSAQALTAAGAGLLERFRPSLRNAASGREVVAELRRFLAMFQPASAELGFYGAFSFDYFLLGNDAPLPDDGRTRLVLYFPERVLKSADSGANWIDFRFPGIGQGTTTGIPPARVAAAHDELQAGQHAARVAAGQARLRSGELYSLVLSQTFRRQTTVRPSSAFDTLRKRNPYPGMFFCNLGGGEVLFGASPDLQVRADATHVEAAPVCGTFRRGANPLEDAQQALALLASEKEGAAIALCADSAASEHGAVCEPGSVELVSFRRLHFFSTIIHAIDHLRGRRREGLDAFDVLLAHAAPATVTGLPKPAAVRAIAELEAEWRGWYGGAVARLGSDGSLEAYTVLRAARVAGGIAEIRTGGNILVDSKPADEEEESRLKAQTLFRVLAGVASPAAQSSAPVQRVPLRAMDGDDPFREGLRGALAKAGAVPDELGVIVVSGRVGLGAISEPLLAIGDGALQLLEDSGAPVIALARPEFARLVLGRAVHEGFLRELGDFHAGWYTARAIRSGTLPPVWLESAYSKEGWVLAAQHRTTRRCAILFRPESVLSTRADTGVRSLAQALAWLQRLND
jgi:anthranilate synthase